jgi:Uma2 family endonuclease
MASPPTTGASWGGLQSLLRPFTVEEYHKLIQAGVFEEDDPFELLEGYLVKKMGRNPPHDGTIQLVDAGLKALLPSGLVTRVQSAITLSDSEPEPDVVVARGSLRSYLKKHPEPSDIGLVVEVADSSLRLDRTEKGRIYARAAIPIYWVVNLIDGQVEVFTGPSGPAAVPVYAQSHDFPVGTNVPFALDGLTLGPLPVGDLLP